MWRYLTDGSMTAAELALTCVIQSTVLLVLGLLAGRWLRQSGPAVQSTVYRTTLAAVLLCPSASMLLAALGCAGLILRLPDQRAGDTVAARLVTLRSSRASEHDTTADRSRERFTDKMSEPGARAATPRSAGVRGLEAKSAVEPVSSGPAVATLARVPGWLAWGILAALGVWLTGSTLLAARLAVGQWRMARLRTGAIRAEPDAVALCGELAHRMGLHAPAVLRSPFLSSPCLDGLRNPVILLPGCAESNSNLRETLIHELAHLARRDGLWNLIRRLSTAAFWVQPLLWMLSRRLEVTAEEVCDDYVVQFGADRARYAGHLLELAERTLPPLAPTGVGMVSLRSLLARRVTRILDSSRVLSTRAGARAVAATVLAGLIGTLLAGLIGVGAGNRRVFADEPKGGKPDKTLYATLSTPPQKKTVRGRVVGPDGEPFAGATITVARYHRAATDPWFSGSGSNWKPVRQEMDRAHSDADGQFRLTFEDRAIGLAEDRDSPDRWDTPLIVAWAPGFGPDWMQGDMTEDRPLRLARDDVPINGRVVDREGRPVVGAAIRVHRLENPESASAVDRWLKAVAASPAGDDRWFPGHKQLPGSEPAVSVPAATDADGRFRLNGLGQDRMATLEVSGPSIVLRRIQVFTRLMKAVGGGTVDRARLLDMAYHGATCKIVTEPSRAIEGLVRDAETDEPIPGVIVTAMQLFGSTLSIEGMIATTTDSSGRYRLTGLPKGDGHQLSVYPALDRPYFVADFLKVPDSRGLGPVHFDIALKRGIWINGKVSDATTGRPVQAAIHYYPFLTNKHAEGYPNFHSGISLFWTGNRYRTGADGRYRLVGLPGQGIVAVKTFDRSYRQGVGIDGLSVKERRLSDGSYGLPTYNAMNPREFQAVAEVDPPDDALEAGHDFLLQPGISLTVQVVDPDGEPLTDVAVEGRSAVIPEVGDMNLHEQTRFQVVSLDPKATRTVVFQQVTRNLGAVLVIKAGDEINTGEQIVTLRACATAIGRLVDAEGKPVRGEIEPRLHYGDNNEGEEILRTKDLDAAGRFRIDGLAPGASYTHRAKDPADYRATREPERLVQSFEMVRNLTALPGQVIDIGTFNAATGERFKEPKVPPAIDDDRGNTRARGDVPITGRIIDLEGRPVAGATVRIVSFCTARTGDLTPWLDAVRSGQPTSIARQHLDYVEVPATAPVKVTTDQRGGFRFERFGAERVAHLLLEGPTIASAFFTVVTRPIKSFPALGFSSNQRPGTEIIHGADFTYSVAPGRAVEGTVRDAQTKKPLSRVIVQSSQRLHTNIATVPFLETTSDGHGRFHLVGLARERVPQKRGNQMLLTLLPNDDQPYFMRNVPVPDPPGLGPVSIEIELHRGIWIVGKVTDKKTGLPIKDVTLHYLPFLDNKFAQATPEFGPSRSVLVIHQDRYKTKSDGAYRLVGLAGHAIVGVAPWDRVPYRFGYGFQAIKGKDERGRLATWWNPMPPGETSLLSMKEIDPAEGVEVVHVDLELDPGASVRVRVVDANGKPLPGTSVTRRMSTSNSETMPGADFDVVALGPAEDRGMLLRHEAKKLGKAIHLHPGDDKEGPVVVKLEPLATIVGRVQNDDGDPVSGATIRATMLPFGNSNPSLPPVATGKDGRFQITDVPAGSDYRLVLPRGSNLMGNRLATTEIKIRPGEITDAGEIRLKSD